jgi:hypothetical protein
MYLKGWFCGEACTEICSMYYQEYSHCDCNIVNNILFKIYEQLQINCGVSSVSPGEIEHVDCLYINSILLITKYYIYPCKFKKVVPSFSGVLHLLRCNYKIEMFSASMLLPAMRQRVRYR